MRKHTSCVILVTSLVLTQAVSHIFGAPGIDDTRHEKKTHVPGLLILPFIITLLCTAKIIIYSDDLYFEADVDIESHPNDLKW